MLQSKEFLSKGIVLFYLQKRLRIYIQHILATLAERNRVAHSVPRSFLCLEELMITQRRKYRPPVIPFEYLSKLAAVCMIKLVIYFYCTLTILRNDLKKAIKFLVDAGVIYYDEIDTLKDFVIIDPQVFVWYKFFSR